jgi:acyl-CoA thioester hydrolase
MRAGEEVEVHSRCSRIGTKSFDLDHQIWAADRLVAEAKSVLVGYDYRLGASVPLTEDLRRKLTA